MLKSDRATNLENDILGRKYFASEIAKSLQHYSAKNNESITISITGPWGSGKSTLMSMIKDQLKGEKDNSIRTKIINYNPWIFYKEGSVRENFLMHFALSIRDFDKKRTILSKKMEEFVKGFKWLKYINSTAGNVQQGFADFFEYYAENDSIPEIKDEIENILIKRKQKLFVFLDDIDRLSCNEILQLFQTISLVLNFSNVYYIIAFDKEIVIQAVEKEYAKLGEAYLEKIIQVDYSIPQVSSDDFMDIFFSELSLFEETYQIKLDDGAMRTIWSYKGLSAYFTNIRDIKRFLNSLTFRLPNIANEVNTVDFIVLEAIRLFDNRAFRTFYDQFTSNLRKRNLPNSGLHEEQLNTYKPITKELLKAILSQKPIDSMFISTSGKRLFDPSYFERYFTLSINRKDVQQKFFTEFMERADKRANILTTALNNATIDNLVNRLTDPKIYDEFPSCSFDLVLTLINFANSNPGYFEKESYSISQAIINLLSKSKGSEKMFEEFFKLIANQTNFPNPVLIYFSHFIRMFTRENRSFGVDDRFDFYYKGNYNRIMVNAKKDFSGSAKALMSPTFSDSCPMIKYLCLLNFCELSPDEYELLLPALLQDKKFVFFMIKQFVWVDSDGKTLVGYRKEPAMRLFPKNYFNVFYDSVKDLAKNYWLDTEKTYFDYFLKPEPTDWPETEGPS